MEKNVLKTAPAVFAVGKEYQIMVPVTCPVLMWVKLGEEEYFDDSNGIIRSAVTMHRITVPMEELNREKKYTLCYRKIIERKPYFSETEDIVENIYDFRPVEKENPVCYHIADAHNRVDTPVKAALNFAKEKGNLDFLILNGDVPDHSGAIENFDNIYEMAAQITGGNIPVVFSRGNHDTRGIYAENIAEYTPCLNGNSFFSFRLGCIWGLVIDCGEDKVDAHPEYGNTVCCHAFRKRQTRYIESLIKNADSEYNAEGINHKIAVCHVPFTRRMKEPFNIEPEIYSYWAKLLKEEIKPEVMICGHEHILDIVYPNEERELHGHPCPIIIAAKPEDDKYSAAGITFKDKKINVIFNSSDGEIIREEDIQI